MESPESWFEDFGSGSLAGGTASIQLDPDFAAVVHSESYQVFLTAEGDSRGLYVDSKTPSGFVVHEQQGGASSVAFSYRVVARRKDVAAPRLARVAPEVMKQIAAAAQPAAPMPPRLLDKPRPPEIPAVPKRPLRAPSRS
jgi:hypothetical protein